MQPNEGPMDQTNELQPSTPAQSFHIGRVPHISRQQRELLRRRRRATRVKTRSTHTLHNERRPFPLTQSKTYDFSTNMLLYEFPRSTVSAIIHLQTIMAPPPPDCKTPKIFQLTPVQLKNIHDAFYENIKARWAFRRLWILYCLKKSKLMNEGVDPITLEAIENPIKVGVLKTRAIYDFEPKSLAKTWTANLVHNDGLFHEPRYPTNPFTNLSLNILQVHLGIQAIRKSGNSSWILESFADCQYNIEKWKKKFAAPLRVECLNRVFNDINNYDRFETILDFIELQHEYHGLDFNSKMYRWILTSPQTKEYADIWAKECRNFYIEKYAVNDKEDLENLEIKTSINTGYLMEIPTVIKVLYRKHIEQTNVSSRRVQNRVITVRASQSEGYLLGRPNI